MDKHEQEKIPFQWDKLEGMNITFKQQFQTELSPKSKWIFKGELEEMSIGKDKGFYTYGLSIPNVEYKWSKCSSKKKILSLFKKFETRCNLLAGNSQFDLVVTGGHHEF